jgi:hypothetical protein
MYQRPTLQRFGTFRELTQVTGCIPWLPWTCQSRS